MPQSNSLTTNSSQDELFHLLTESFPDIVAFEVDVLGKVHIWNEASKSLFGFDAEEVLGKPVEMLFPREETDAHDTRIIQPQSAMNDAIKDRSARVAGWCARKNGTRFWAESIVRAVRSDTHEVTRLVFLVRAYENSQVPGELVLEQSRLSAFNRDIGIALNHMQPLHDMLNRCTDVMVEHLQGAFARIWTLSVDQKTLELRASSGEYMHLDGEHSRVPVGQLKIGRIAASRQPHLTNSVIGDPQVSNQDWARENGMVAFAGYPLLVDDRLVGVMAMFARQKLSDGVLQAMASVADWIALGIERKSIEEKRSQQESWMQVMMTSIGDAVIATDGEGSITFLNKAAQSITGWTIEAARGLPLEKVFRILDEKTREPAESPFREVLAKDAVVDLGNGLVLISKDGCEHPINDSAAPIRDTDGKTVGVILVFRDVTVQRRAESNMLQSDARKSAILETAMDCIISMDHLGQVIEFNPAAEKTFGYKRDEVLGKELAGLIIPQAFREQHRRGMAHYLATGEGPVLSKRLELSAMRADGQEFPVELAITRIPMEGPPIFTAYLRDITEQKRRESHRNIRLAVTNVLNQATGSHDGIKAVLGAVCENLGWEVGCYWAVDSLSGRLRYIDSWFTSATNLAIFAQESAVTEFKLGQGLPGRVWSSGNAAWIIDISSDSNFLRINSAKENGLRSAFACPVVTDGQLIGVIEFFTKEMHPPDVDLLEMMTTMSSQIGQFIKRQQAMLALRNSEFRFRGLMEQAPFSIHIFSPDGKTLSVNRAWEELWGIRSEQVQSYNILEDVQLVAKSVMPFIRKGFEGEISHIPAVCYDPKQTPLDGVTATASEKWVSAVLYPLKDANGQVQEVVIVHEDITARKKAEDALRAAHRDLEFRIAERTSELMRGKEFLQTLLENVQTGVVACDAEGKLTLFNGITRQLHGLTEETLTPETWADRYKLFKPDGTTPMQMEDIPLYRAFRGERVLNAEMVIKPEGDSPKVVLVSGQAIYDSHGQKLGAVVSMHDITARKEAEEALARVHTDLELRVEQRTNELALANAALMESEAKLRLMADTIPQLAWMARPDGLIFWYNRRWYKYTGSDADEVFGWGWMNWIAQEELPDVLDRWKACLASGDVFDMIYSIRGADGNYRQFLTRVNPLRDDSGKILYWFGTNTDITEIREARGALAESEERLRMALDAGRMGVWDWNVVTNELNWSDSLEPLHGLAPGTFGGTFAHFQELIHPEDRENVQAKIRGALEQGGVFDTEFRNIWSNGSIHWIAGKGRAFNDRNGHPIRMIGIGMDITSQKRVEKTARFLAEASSLLAVLVDFDSTLQKVASLSVPYFADWAAVDMLEPDGSLRRVAVAHSDSEKVQLAHDVNRRFPPDPNAPQGIWNILRTGQSELVSIITDEMLVESIENREYLDIMLQLGLQSYIGVPLKVRGKTIGVLTFVAAESGHNYDETDLAVAQDLASRAAIAIENSQLYRELREADRRKDEFLAMLAHELRNPLAPIRNGLQVMCLIGSEDPTVSEARTMMERQLNQMVRLVDDLLDVSRITRNKLELRKQYIELATVVRNAIETSRPLIEKSGHTLTVELTNEPIMLDADAVRLAQVFSNLINNAAKYTDPGGHIAVRAGLEGNEVIVQVNDNGIGIPPDALPRIFDMFSQVDRNLERAQGGLGIGLTLVRRLVEMHNGRVEAHSAGQGLGSEFAVHLPITQKPPQKHETKMSINNASSKTTKRRILVVDDNKDSASSLSLMLKIMGNETKSVHDGLAAVQAAEEFQPEIILLDIGLPKLNGYDACRAMREQAWSQGMVIIALTGWGQDEDRRLSAEAGFDHHLVKPVEIATLQKLFSELQSPEVSESED